MDEIERLARPEILALRPYRSARSESAAGDGAWSVADASGAAPAPILLDANESPAPPLALAGRALAANRYPEPQPRELLERFAAAYAVDPGGLLLTRGASEAIDLLVRAFCAAGRDGVIVTPPTFELYGLAAAIQGAATHAVPLVDGFSADGADARAPEHGPDGAGERGSRRFQVDVAGVLETQRRHPSAKLVFLCTPGNPTGNLLRREDVLHVCEQLRGRALVVADQSYVAFSGERPLSDELAAHPNLVVLRTLSKEHGLAGERLGLAVASPAVIDVLRRLIAPYPLPQSVVASVLAATDPDGMREARRAVAHTVAERERVAQALRASSAALRVHPSDANFLLVEVARPALLLAAMQRARISVRDRSDVEGIHGCVRISIGAPDENDAMLDAFAGYASAATAIGAMRG